MTAKAWGTRPSEVLGARRGSLHAFILDRELAHSMAAWEAARAAEDAAGEDHGAGPGGAAPSDAQGPLSPFAAAAAELGRAR